MYPEHSKYKAIQFNADRTDAGVYYSLPGAKNELDLFIKYCKSLNKAICNIYPNNDNKLEQELCTIKYGVVVATQERNVVKYDKEKSAYKLVIFLKELSTEKRNEIEKLHAITVQNQIIQYSYFADEAISMETAFWNLINFAKKLRGAFTNAAVYNKQRNLCAKIDSKGNGKGEFFKQNL